MSRRRSLHVIAKIAIILGLNTEHGYECLLGYMHRHCSQNATIDSTINVHNSHIATRTKLLVDLDRSNLEILSRTSLIDLHA